MFEMAFRKEPTMKKWILTGLGLMLVLSLFSASVSAQGVTNEGKRKLLSWTFYGSMSADSLPPDTFYIVLCTAEHTPTTATNRMNDLTEIANGTGYESGGGDGTNEGWLVPTTTHFDALSVTDSTATISIRDIIWTASGGGIPNSGDGASWAVLTDNNTTIASRVVYAWWDLTSARSVTDGNTLTLQDLELEIETTP